MKTETRKRPVQNLTLSALCLALGLVLPFLVGQIPQLGSALLPMHLPVLLCGLICGWAYGGTVGFILPPLRYLLFGMPPIFPTGVAMAFELATYGILAGLLYGRSRRQCVFALYRSLILAMIGGRIVWGVVRVLLSGVAGQAFTWELFLAGAFLNAIPGILLQLILIPAILVALDRTGLVPFHRAEKKPADAV
jgi:thiamine transporter ThiT